ncbi:hypothetical protein ERO13_D06G152650v2 [Gossypium hirsutum]|nr:hypothetical protein ERO13_D06G152650v2 [Gossypium hirsutum]
MLDREASLRRARAEASLFDGISWGMGEDAIEEAKRYHLHSISKGDAFIIAQERESLSNDTSFTFLGYKIIRVRSALLGRTWAAYFKVIFALSYMSNVIQPQGWDDWGDTSKRSTVFCKEY